MTAIIFTMFVLTNQVIGLTISTYILYNKVGNRPTLCYVYAPHTESFNRCSRRVSSIYGVLRLSHAGLLLHVGLCFDHNVLESVERLVHPTLHAWVEWEDPRRSGFPNQLFTRSPLAQRGRRQCQVLRDIRPWEVGMHTTDDKKVERVSDE